VRWFRPRAIPPENVQLVLADGSKVAADCIYVGWKDGSHRWNVIIPTGVVPVSMSIDMLPGRTSIGVSLAPTMGGPLTR
jgi:hypothetical protein